MNQDTKIDIDAISEKKYELVKTKVLKNESIEDKKKWSKNEQKLLIKWADHATCLKWMHSQSYKQYLCRNAWLSIPVIIISTATGTANFAQLGIDAENNSTVSMIIGAFNILAAIITTIMQFLKVSQLLEGHRIAYISWDKFARKIKVDLTKETHTEIDKLVKFTAYREEYDRLTEISPEISNIVIRNFNRMVYSGKLSEIDNGKTCICCYESCCLPFGIEPCCKKKKKLNKIQLNNLKLELPDICGQIKATIEIVNGCTDEINEYKIYDKNKNTEENIKLDKNI